jgi:hypothetical protein
MKKHQKGFTAVEGLLIVVILGMLGGVAWYVINSQKQVDKTYSQTTNSTVVPKKTATNSTEPLVKNLVIKEWGVKLPLTSDDVGAYYSYNTSASMNVKYYDGITLHDETFDQLKNSEGTDCKGTDLYFIVRAKTSDISKLTDENSPDYVGDTNKCHLQKIMNSLQDVIM